MKQYKQLATGQRYQIYGLKQSGLNQTQIALNVDVTLLYYFDTISINLGRSNYLQITGYANNSANFLVRI